MLKYASWNLVPFNPNPAQRKCMVSFFASIWDRAVHPEDARWWYMIINLPRRWESLVLGPYPTSHARAGVLQAKMIESLSLRSWWLVEYLGDTISAVSRLFPRPVPSQKPCKRYCHEGDECRSSQDASLDVWDLGLMWLSISWRWWWRCGRRGARSWCIAIRRNEKVVQVDCIINFAINYHCMVGRCVEIIEDTCIDVEK